VDDLLRCLNPELRRFIALSYPMVRAHTVVEQTGAIVLQCSDTSSQFSLRGIFDSPVFPPGEEQTKLSQLCRITFVSIQIGSHRYG
jgi:hypothetical protein